MTRKSFTLPDGLAEDFARVLAERGHSLQAVLLDAVETYVHDEARPAVSTTHCSWCGKAVGDHAIGYDGRWFDRLTCFEASELEQRRVSWLDIWGRPHPTTDGHTWSVLSGGTEVVAQVYNTMRRKQAHCHRCGGEISSSAQEWYEDVCLVGRTESGSTYHLACTIPPVFHELKFRWAVRKAAPEINLNKLTLR